MHLSLFIDEFQHELTHEAASASDHVPLDYAPSIQYNVTALPILKFQGTGMFNFLRDEFPAKTGGKKNKTNPKRQKKKMNLHNDPDVI